MATPTRAQLAAQLRALRKSPLFDLLAAAAKTYKLDLAYLLAIGSRESGLKNICGDLRGGEFHGVGILQIDVQHDIARKARDSGSWESNPRPLIEFGAAMLAHNLAAVRGRFPGYTEAQAMKVSASGYNAGLGSAIAGSQAGDSDKYTTGASYGRDTMARRAIFQELLAAS